MGTDADALESLSKARLQPRAHPLFFSRPGRRVCGAQDERVSARSRTLNDVPGVAEYVRGTLASFAADKMFKAAGKRCLELQDFLSKELPPEIHHKMLPASRTVALRQTSKTMRTAVEKADAVVQARRRVQFPDGQGLLDKLSGLNAWCKVTVLRLTSCGLGEGGGRALAEALRLNTTVTELDLDDNGNGLGEGGGRTLAETLRLNTTLTELTSKRMTWELNKIQHFVRPGAIGGGHFRA